MPSFVISDVGYKAFSAIYLVKSKISFDLFLHPCLLCFDFVSLPFKQKKKDFTQTQIIEALNMSFLV